MATKFNMLSTLLACTFLSIISVHAADDYDTRCTEAKNTTTVIGNSTTTMITSDSCDTSKFLACRSERCACQDPANQIYTYREYMADDPPVIIRSKRSPGKGSKGGGGGGKSKSRGGGKSKSRGDGGGKSKSSGEVSTGGGVAGVSGGVIGYELAKYSGSSSSGSGSSSGSYSSHDNKKVKVYSCYSRIQGDCALDPKKINTIVNTTSTTHKDEHGNTTTVSFTQQVDYLKYPICVDDAICKAKQNYTAGADSNIGECECRDGYARSNSDLCVKTNGSQKLNSISLVALFVSFLFIQLLTSKSSQ